MVGKCRAELVAQFGRAERKRSEVISGGILQEWSLGGDRDLDGIARSCRPNPAQEVLVFTIVGKVTLGVEVLPS